MTIPAFVTAWGRERKQCPVPREALPRQDAVALKWRYFFLFFLLSFLYPVMHFRLDTSVFQCITASYDMLCMI